MTKVKDPVHRIVAEIVDKIVRGGYDVGRLLGLWNVPHDELSTYEPERILIIEEEPLGDVIMSTVVYGPLRRRYPKSTIVVLTGSWAAPVLENNPNIDEVLICDCPWAFSDPIFGRKGFFGHLNFIFRYSRFLRKLRAFHFDLAIDLRGDFRNIIFFMVFVGIKNRLGFGRAGGAYLLTQSLDDLESEHEVEKNIRILKSLGCREGAANLCVYPGVRETGVISELLKTAGKEGGVCVIHPGAGRMVRYWPPERYAAIADFIAKNYRSKILLTGGNAELELCQSVISGMRLRDDAINLAGRLTLLEVAALLQRASLMVCPDTSIMHLAAAVGTPTVSLFGPGSPMSSGPYGGVGVVIARDCECRPLQTVCRIASGKFSVCMESIAVADVKSAITKVMAGRSVVG